MSLILEALRKSEAERKLGQAPELLAPMPVLHAPQVSARRNTGPIIGAVSALVLGIVMAGWWVLERPPAAVARSSASAAPSDVPSKPAASKPSSTTAESRTVANPSSAREVSAMTTSGTRVEGDTASGITSPSPAQHPSGPAAAAAPTIGMESAKPRIAGASELASATRQAARLPSFAGSPPAPVEAASTTATPAADAEPGLLPVTALPGSERAQLPALKVTMHAYADDPARRFMIVDGQRVVEGGPLGDGVVLVRIRRDGAEIDIRGRRLLLPDP